MAEPKIINWACGEHPFMLRIGEAEALDDLTRDGVADFRYRCREGVERGSLGFSPVRTREVIDGLRLGLIGGGMEPEAARKLALRGMEEGEFAELVMICFEVVSDFHRGKAYDQLEKPVAVEATETGESA